VLTPRGASPVVSVQRQRTIILTSVASTLDASPLKATVETAGNELMHRHAHRPYQVVRGKPINISGSRRGGSLDRTSP
jgi:hypothetical protein